MGGWPVYTDEEIDAVTGVLRSGKVNAWTGPDVFAFETEYCDYTGAAHAIAMANCTMRGCFPAFCARKSETFLFCFLQW